MDARDEDTARVREHVQATIGIEPDEWTKWLGGWRGDIESALIDAVFSARAIYATAGGRGVSRNIADWQAARTRSTFSLDALLTEIAAVGTSGWASRFGNQQLSPGRSTDAPCGRSKAAAVREAAGQLRKEGINIADDIDVSTATTVKSTLHSVSGIGYATSKYFLMLLGVPGIKPDRMIHRFLKDAAGHAFTNADAVQVLQAVAAHLGVQEHELDHAIWAYERARGRRGRKPRKRNMGALPLRTPLPFSSRDACDHLGDHLPTLSRHIH